MPEKYLAVISDAYLKAFDDVMEDYPFKLMGYSTVEKGIEGLGKVSAEDLVGIIIAITSWNPEEDTYLLETVPAALSLYSVKCRILLYSNTETVFRQMQQIFRKVENQHQVLYLNPYDKMDETFIKRDMIGSVLSTDEIYRVDSGDNIKSLVSRFQNKEVKSLDEDIATTQDFLKELVRNTENVVEVKRSLTSEVQDLMRMEMTPATKQNLTKALVDPVLEEHKHYIDKLKKEIKVLKEQNVSGSKSVELEKLQMNLKIAEASQDKRATKIIMEMIQESIQTISASVDDKLGEFKRESESLITSSQYQTQRDEIDHLIRQRTTLEMRLKEYVTEVQTNNQLLVGQLNGIVAGADVQALDIYNEYDKSPNKHLLEDQKNAISLLAAVAKRQNIDANKISKQISALATNWQNQITNMMKMFNNISSLNHLITDKQSHLIDTLYNSKDIVMEVTDPLAKKAIGIIGPERVGKTTVALGVAHYLSKEKKTVIVDLDHVSPNLSYHVNQHLTVEDLVGKTVNEVLDVVARHNLTYITMSHSYRQFCFEHQMSEKDFHKSVVNVLDNICHDVDFMILILPQNDSESSSILLKRLAVVALISDIDISTYRKVNAIGKRLDLLDNIKVRFLVLNKLHQEFKDTEKQLTAIGLSQTKYRVKSVPFLPIDIYKLDGKNSFIERPPLVESFKL